MLATSASICKAPVAEITTVSIADRATVTSGQLTVTIEMTSSEIIGARKRFFDAARNGQLEEVIELSSKFENDVKVLSQALIRLCDRGHLAVVKWLGGNTTVDVNYFNTDGWWNTPLIAACYYDHLEIVKYLVETCHADVNLPDSKGNTPLSRACRNFSMSVSSYLLCEISDLDVNIANKDGNTALHLTVWCSKDNKTQLHKACNRGGDVTEVSRLVYEEGHKVNVQDNHGNTPLHLACSYGRSDIVETLMLAGANETITNDEQKTPAQVAESEGYKILLKLLNRDSLWQMMILRQQNKLTLVVLMVLTLRLMKQIQKTGRWYYTFVTIVHVIKCIIVFNREN